MGPRFPMHPMLYGQYPYPTMHPFMPYYPQGYMPESLRMQYDNYYTNLNPYAEPWNPNIPGGPPAMYRGMCPPYSVAPMNNVSQCPACSHKLQEEQRKKETLEHTHHTHICTTSSANKGGNGANTTVSSSGYEGHYTCAGDTTSSIQYNQQCKHHLEHQHQPQQQQQQKSLQHQQLPQESKQYQEQEYQPQKQYTVAKKGHSETTKQNYSPVNEKTEEELDEYGYQGQQKWSNNDDEFDDNKNKSSQLYYESRSPSEQNGERYHHQQQQQQQQQYSCEQEYSDEHSHIEHSDTKEQVQNLVTFFGQI